MLLLILGHEAAHYLNRHNEHNNNSNIDSQEIERWADFFGTKIAFVVLSFGDETRKFLNFMPKSSMKRIEIFSLALQRLSNAYFEKCSYKYPDKSTRIGTCVAGLLSFLEQYFKWSAIEFYDPEAYIKSQNPKIIVQRALAIQMKIYTIIELEEELISSEVFHEKHESDMAGSKIISEVHRRIQGRQKALFEGMKPRPAMWLRLDYSMPEKIRKKFASEKIALLKSTLAELNLSFP